MRERQLLLGDAWTRGDVIGRLVAPETDRYVSAARRTGVLPGSGVYSSFR